MLRKAATKTATKATETSCHVRGIWLILSMLLVATFIGTPRQHFIRVGDLCKSLSRLGLGLLIPFNAIGVVPERESLVGFLNLLWRSIPRYTQN